MAIGRSFVVHDGQSSGMPPSYQMDRPHRTTDIVSSAATLAVLGLGVLVLAGWAGDIESLKRVAPSFPTMNPLTAASFIASACSLWLLGSKTPGLRLVSLGLAILTLTTAILNLTADLGALYVEPDHILFREAVKSITPPSEMAPSTSVGFVVAALALTFFHFNEPKRRSVGQYFAFALACVAMFGAISYIYGAEPDRAFKPFSLMAVHTALGLLLLAIGLLFKTTDLGWMSLIANNGAASRPLAWKITAAIVAPIILGWLCMRGLQAGYFGNAIALTILACVSMGLLIIMVFATTWLRQETEKERQRQDEVLRVSEARISGIVSIAADAIISVDLHRRITLFNAWAEKIFGYPASEVLGQQLEMLLPERFRVAHAGHVSAFGSGAVQARRMGDRQEIYALRKDGSEFPADATISKLSLNGEAIYTVVLRDMTERRRAALALQIAKEEAEAAGIAKSEFLANMSHEIRTPLNSISGFTQLLLEQNNLEGELLARVKKIGTATMALTTIVNDILDYSKLEEGKIALSFGPFSPAQLIDQCVSMMSSIADRKDVPICVVQAPEMKDKVYVGDANRVQQVLLNLLSNAIKFTRKGVVTITLEEEAPRGELVQVRISVADTGIGISPDRVGRLFERFSQVDSSVSRKFGGTGLGLAICQRLVTLMGGKSGWRVNPAKVRRSFSACP